jgi:heterodisulfide reductase subunit C
MAILIRKEINRPTLMESVAEISGVNIRECLQCKKCTNGCPVARLSHIGPAETIRRLQLNTGDELLESDLIWMCVSCETCYSRCPMNIDMAAIMDALRIIAVRKKPAARKGNVHIFNKSFLNTVRIFGRTYDLGIIAAYKLGTLSYFQDVKRFPMMVWKRKIAFLPNWHGSKKYIDRIFQFWEKQEKDDQE